MTRGLLRRRRVAAGRVGGGRVGGGRVGGGALLAAAALVLALLAPAGPAAARAAPAGPNLVANPGFEQVAGRARTPRGWTPDAWRAGATLVSDTARAHGGHRSVRISSPVPNDARWVQTVPVQPGTRYRLSGWVRTSRVAHTAESVDAGANLSVLDRADRTPAVLGTRGWTFVSVTLDSGDATSLRVCARLGFTSGTATGTAWFDDVRLERIGRTPPARWKVLVLVYPKVDVRWTDPEGRPQHVTSEITREQQQAAAAAAQAFLRTDVPALTGGAMQPVGTVRVVDRTLTELDAFGDGWWPGPGITAPELDPAFDAVLVIWQPSGVDANTGEPRWFGAAGGLAYPRGTGQTYASMILDSVIGSGTRNIFRHEFGHSVLWYFEAAGLTPSPTVSNHSDGSDYVHCGTGRPYVWTDETLADPIPNSIYNIWSGFTHDYYSGTTALATDPDRCLGIGRTAWASGSPTAPRSGAPSRSAPVTGSPVS